MAKTWIWRSTRLTWMDKAKHTTRSRKQKHMAYIWIATCMERWMNTWAIWLTIKILKSQHWKVKSAKKKNYINIRDSKINSTQEASIILNLPKLCSTACSINHQVIHILNSIRDFAYRRKKRASSSSQLYWWFYDIF